MTRIEYDGVTVDVPQSWADLTVKDYEEAMALPNRTLREKVAVVARLCRTTEETLRALPVEMFSEIIDRIGFVWQDFDATPSPALMVGGVKYVVALGDALSFGEWIDADEVQKGGERIFSQLLAIVCRPIGEAYDSARTAEQVAFFEGLPVEGIQGVITFFLICAKRLENRTASFSRLAETAERLRPSIKRSLADGGGTRFSRILRTIEFWILTASLRYQLRKCSPSSRIERRGARRRKRNARSTNN